MNAYIIRSVNTGKMVSAWEGEDGKITAQERTEVHNKLYPNDQWYVSEEVA